MKAQAFALLMICALGLLALAFEKWAVFWVFVTLQVIAVACFWRAGQIHSRYRRMAELAQADPSTRYDRYIL